MIEYKESDDRKMPKHIYTIEFNRAMYTDEIFEVYRKYELAVHKKVVDKDELKHFLCNSPVYDPNKDIEFRNTPCFLEPNDFDKFLIYKDEGFFPGFGTFHMYHGIDGRVIAVGVIDILKTIFHSAYFFYDPDFSFLHMGVVGAVMEMQYMRYLREKIGSETAVNNEEIVA
mgnify:CR=1 FL=1